MHTRDPHTHHDVNVYTSIQQRFKVTGALMRLARKLWCVPLSQATVVVDVTMGDVATRM